MKKVLSILLVAVMLLGLAACGEKEEAQVYKIGMVCIGDETQAYDQNFYKAADAAKEQLAAKGINIEWVYTKNHPDGEPVKEDCVTLADDGCLVVFCNSYGHEYQSIEVAPDYPNVTFVGCTNELGAKDDLDNTINAMPAIYEARYLAGIAAGMKLNELIENGTITADQANLGYVGAYTYAEVLSGYTAYFLGARSVCPTAKMYVNFIGDWGDYALEQESATTLIDKYNCIIISQHSDQVSPAEVAREKGVFHVGYNVDMSVESIAPTASIIASRIDWTNYFVKVITAAVNGEKQDQDYIGYGLKTGDVCLTDLNEAIAAPGTADAIAAARKAIEDGTLQVFDTSKFTVDGGQELTTFVVDGVETVFDGAYHEAYTKSAPSLSFRVDGIELTNEKF